MKKKTLLMMASMLMFSFTSVFAQLDWVTYEGEMPENAVIGGVADNMSLAVCRCKYKGAKHPGKVVAKACNIGWGGKEMVISDFEVLVNRGLVELHWLKTDGPLPPGAVKGGTEGRNALYIGRSYHENGTHPGKIFNAGNSNICNIGWGGKEITYNTFEVLVANEPEEKTNRIGSDIRCSKKMNKSNFVVGQYIGQMSKERKSYEGTSMVSTNLKYQTRVTDDGRLVVDEILDKVLCDNGQILVFDSKEIWSNTNDSRDASLNYFLKFQEDGNLCIYSDESGFVWCSMTNGKNAHHFEITNLGHIEIMNDHGGEIWPD